MRKFISVLLCSFMLLTLFSCEMTDGKHDIFTPNKTNSEPPNETDDNGNEYLCSEQFSERAYSNETLSKMLKKAKLEVLAVLDENGQNKPSETEQRIIYVTRKI